MTTTTTTTKRTTKAKPAAAAPTDTTAVLPDETVDAYVARQMGYGTLEGAATAAAVVAKSDRAFETDTFIGRVHRSKRAGDLAIHTATIIAGGIAPKAFADVTKALDMDDKNGRTFAGKAFSTLRECYRMSGVYNADEVSAFADVWAKVHGTAPAVRECLAWLDRLSDDTATGWIVMNTEAAYRKAKADREAASATAANTAAAGRERTKVLLTAGAVEGVDALTPAMWQGMTKAQLLDIARLANALALTADDRAKVATAAATAEAAAREVEVETGPTAAATPKRRRSVAA